MRELPWHDGAHQGGQGAVQGRRRTQSDLRLRLAEVLFVPSLIWLAFGRRRVEDIFYDVGKLMPEKYMLFKNHHGMAYMP